MEKSKIIVILDAGHGINTSGKRSPYPHDLQEWRYNRDIVSGIASRLRAEGIECYIDHPEDLEIGGQSRDLSIRTGRANACHSRARKNGRTTILVSVHVNASGACNGWANANGWTVWVAKGASQDSRRLARLLYDEADKRGLRGNRSAPACRYWEADFWMLRKSVMPAVLTENLFMDNRNDVEYLLSPEGRFNIISLHADAIKKYIETANFPV